MSSAIISKIKNKLEVEDGFVGRFFGNIALCARSQHVEIINSLTQAICLDKNSSISCKLLVEFINHTDVDNFPYIRLHPLIERLPTLIESTTDHEKLIALVGIIRCTYRSQNDELIDLLEKNHAKCLNIALKFIKTDSNSIGMSLLLSLLSLGSRQLLHGHVQSIKSVCVSLLDHPVHHLSAAQALALTIATGLPESWESEWNRLCCELSLLLHHLGFPIVLAGESSNALKSVSKGNPARKQDLNDQQQSADTTHTLYFPALHAKRKEIASLHEIDCGERAIAIERAFIGLCQVLTQVINKMISNIS